MKTKLAILGWPVLFLVGIATALGQERPSPQPDGSPSGYVESIEAPGDVGGVEDEVDASEAQALQAEATGETPEGPSRRQTERVEEIVVQARKRDEFLEDTPVSVTALSEDTLREAGVTRFDDIQTLVPNLQMDASPAVSTASQIRIRGIGTSAPSVAFDPGVGVYVDGVFLPRALGSIVDLLDIQQIEVLRGPQGTLFGKNTVGGAINITTMKPHEELEGFAFLRPGNLGTINTRVMLNLPVAIGALEDRLFTRLSFASSNSGGYTLNESRDEYWSDRDSVAFLGSLRFLPTDDVTIDVSGNYSRTHSHGLGGECALVQETALQEPRVRRCVSRHRPLPQRRQRPSDCGRGELRRLGYGGVGCGRPIRVRGRNVQVPHLLAPAGGAPPNRFRHDRLPGRADRRDRRRH